MSDVNHDTKATETSTTTQAEKLTESLFALGAAWARYGLSVGKLALETSAKTLEGTSKVLGHLADTLDTKKAAS